MRAIILALALSTASARFFTENESTLRYMFNNFKEEHGKQYNKDEEPSRFENFKQNLKIIDARNAKDSSATHGITKFADMTVEEFKTTHLNHVHFPNANRTVDETIKRLPPGVKAQADWSGTFSTPVKDQGACGSCWAFSVTEQIESDWLREGGEELILSAQQIASCTNYILPWVGGCNGGKPENGFKYAESGVVTEEDYPYFSGNIGRSGKCDVDISEAKVKTTSFTNVGTDEATIAAYVATTGPLTMVVDASEWSSYTGGIVSSCGTNLDHAVQVVGVNEEEGYWKVRNSWGTSWGESGYIRLEFGSNMCGLTADCNYSEVVEV